MEHRTASPPAPATRSSIAWGAALVAGVLIGPLRAQDLLHQFPHPVGAVAFVGHADVDGDGSQDILVGNPYDNRVDHPSGQTAYGGSVHVYSGQSGAELYSIDGHVGCGVWFCVSDALGRSVPGAGDVDQDGFDDYLVVGTAVSLRSGPDGSVLRTWPGLSAANAGDVDFDGIPDQLVGMPISETSGNPGGSAVVYSGIDGSVLFTLKPTGTGVPGSYGLGSFGRAVDGGRDLDGDGRPDFVVSAPNDHLSVGGVFVGYVGSVWVYSGQDGSLLHHLAGDDPHDFFGSSVAVTGDANGDAKADLIACTHRTNMAGYARAFSGADGAILHTFGPLPDSQTLNVGSAGDFNSDGAEDFLVNLRIVEYGQTRVYSGSDGGLLHVFEGSLSDWGLGASGTRAGDVDGDGREDVVLASMFSTVVYTGIEKPWTDLGGGLPGGTGVPALAGYGSLAPATTASVRLENGPASGLGILIVGASEAGIPFKGGVVVPDVDFVFLFVLDPSGSVTFSNDVPGTGPPVPPFLVQAWLQDSGAVQGASASNALLATLPR